MIQIVNKYKHTPTSTDYYCGRGSLFGNPFTHIKDKVTKAEFIVETREKSIELYKDYFYNTILKNSIAIDKLKEMKDKSIKENIYLVCFCYPKSCHTEIIKNYLENDNISI